MLRQRAGRVSGVVGITARQDSRWGIMREVGITAVLAWRRPAYGTRAPGQPCVDYGPCMVYATLRTWRRPAHGKRHELRQSVERGFDGNT